MRTQQKKLLLSLALFFFAVLMVGCRESKLDSKWRDDEFSKGGIHAEWEDSVIYYDEEADVAIGMFNDERAILLFLSIRDRERQAQLMGHGLTIWLDPKGGRNKTFGLHFPLGIQAGGRERIRGEGRKRGWEERVRRAGPEDGLPDADKVRVMFEASQREIEIIGPGKEDRRTMLVADAVAMGINAKMDLCEGRLLYELKVPFVNNVDQVSVIGPVNPKRRIGIGFETGKIDKKKMKEAMGRGSVGMGGPGGMGGGPGGTGGPGGMGRGFGRRGGPGGTMLEPFEFWAKVKLAERPSLSE